MEDDWRIPDERDQMELPRKPDLMCQEHGKLRELLRTFAARLAELKQRVDTLEKE